MSSCVSQRMKREETGGERATSCSSRRSCWFWFSSMALSFWLANPWHSEEEFRRVGHLFTRRDDIITLEEELKFVDSPSLVGGTVGFWAVGATMDRTLVRHHSTYFSQDCIIVLFYRGFISICTGQHVFTFDVLILMMTEIDLQKK